MAQLAGPLVALEHRETIDPFTRQFAQASPAPMTLERLGVGNLVGIGRHPSAVLGAQNARVLGAILGHPLPDFRATVVIGHVLDFFVASSRLVLPGAFRVLAPPLPALLPDMRRVGIHEGAPGSQAGRTMLHMAAPVRRPLCVGVNDLPMGLSARF